jgi:hypothetical protein
MPIERMEIIKCVYWIMQSLDTDKENVKQIYKQGGQKVFFFNETIRA